MTNGDRATRAVENRRRIERQPLEQAHDIPQPIAAPLEYFQLIVESFNKAARLMADEIVRNQI